MYKTVHLRYNLRETKYEMTIPLKVSIESGKIDEEIEIPCSESETIGFLLELANREIENVIREKLGKIVDDVEIHLMRKRQNGFKTIPEDLRISDIISQDHKKTRVVVFDQEFRLIVNAPKITSLILPPIIYAPFVIRPLKFEGLYIRNSLSEFKWYRSRNKMAWEEIGNEIHYSTKKEDIGSFLKFSCVPSSSTGLQGPSAEVISEVAVLELPEIPRCPFSSRHLYTKEKLDGHSYRVVTYNILSSRYTNNDSTYSYCRDEFLVIDYRKRLILKEILGYNADIICLQEMDCFQYADFFKLELEKQGYYAKFYPKGYYSSEGLMCAVRKSRFKLKAYEQIVFCNALKKKDIFKHMYDFLKADKLLLRKIALQPTSLQIFEVKCQEKRIILIGNIHLSHYPENDDIRLVHSYMAIRYMNNLKERLERSHRTHRIDLVLCGDFNSDPASAVYNFICYGELHPIDFLKIGDRRVSLRHTLKLKSACGTPEYSVYTPTFKSCVDYIFVEEYAAEVQQVVPVLEEEVEKNNGLPNEFYPSDHLAFVVDIKFVG